MSKTWACPICKKRMLSINRHNHSCRSKSDRLKGQYSSVMAIAKVLYSEGK